MASAALVRPPATTSIPTRKDALRGASETATRPPQPAPRAPFAPHPPGRPACTASRRGPPAPARSARASRRPSSTPLRTRPETAARDARDRARAPALQPAAPRIELLLPMRVLDPPGSAAHRPPQPAPPAPPAAPCTALHARPARDPRRRARDRTRPAAPPARRALDRVPPTNGGARSAGLWQHSLTRARATRASRCASHGPSTHTHSRRSLPRTRPRARTCPLEPPRPGSHSSGPWRCSIRRGAARPARTARPSHAARGPVLGTRVRPVAAGRLEPLPVLHPSARAALHSPHARDERVRTGVAWAIRLDAPPVGLASFVWPRHVYRCIAM